MFFFILENEETVPMSSGLSSTKKSKDVKRSAKKKTTRSKF